MNDEGVVSSPSGGKLLPASESSRVNSPSSDSARVRFQIDMKDDEESAAPRDDDNPPSADPMRSLQEMMQM